MHANVLFAFIRVHSRPKYFFTSGYRSSCTSGLSRSSFRTTRAGKSICLGGVTPFNLSTSVFTASKPILNGSRSEEHTSELQSHLNLVCRLLLEKKKKKTDYVSTCNRA